LWRRLCSPLGVPPDDDDDDFRPSGPDFFVAITAGKSVMREFDQEI